MSGWPDSLCYLPEIHGGTTNLVAHVPDDELQYARVQLVEQA